MLAWAKEQALADCTGFQSVVVDGRRLMEVIENLVVLVIVRRRVECLSYSPRSSFLAVHSHPHPLLAAATPLHGSSNPSRSPRL